jgi:hypothetical protein
MTEFVVNELSAAQSHFQTLQSLSCSINFPPFMEIATRFINVVIITRKWPLF